MGQLKEQVDLPTLANDVLLLYQNMAEEKGINVKSEMPEITVKSDRKALGICLQNLVHNALKFTPESGQVIISATQSSSGHCRVTVVDTGLGISEERLEQIMNGATHLSVAGTRGEPGYGLGVSIVLELVEKMGGKFSITSEKGIGTMAAIELPIT